MKQKGFVEIIFAVAVLVIILSLFGVSLATIFNNQTLQENFEFIWNWIKFVWAWLLQNIYYPIRDTILGIF